MVCKQIRPLLYIPGLAQSLTSTVPLSTLRQFPSSVTTKYSARPPHDAGAVSRGSRGHPNKEVDPRHEPALWLKNNERGRSQNDGRDLRGRSPRSRALQPYCCESRLGLGHAPRSGGDHAPPTIKTAERRGPRPPISRPHGRWCFSRTDRSSASPSLVTAEQPSAYSSLVTPALYPGRLSSPSTAGNRSARSRASPASGTRGRYGGYGLSASA